ncbi:hypothetical protein [Streptomyces puniciscabiei]|uniref:hypothetical protein n=1 Tax=Streptomyces puniciscabiei TaxID=164348 RepID=UPI00332DD1B0
MGVDPRRDEEPAGAFMAGRVAALVVVVVATVAMATGCTTDKTGAGASTAAGQPALRVVSHPAPGADLRLRLDSYDLSLQQHVEIQNAENRFLRQCMKNYGFDLQTPTTHALPYPRNMPLLGQIDALQVSRYGYQGPPGVAADLIAVSKNGSWDITVQPAQLRVFEGRVTSFHGKPVPAGGCFGELQRRLDAGAPRVQFDSATPAVVPERGIRFFKSQVYDQATHDSRFRRTVAEWSRCMGQEGFRYDSPEQAQEDPRWSNADADTRPSAVQIRTAVADDHCRHAVNYTGMLYSLMSVYEQPLIKAQGHVLQEISRLLKARLQNSLSLAAQTQAPVNAAGAGQQRLGELLPDSEQRQVGVNVAVHVLAEAGHNTHPPHVTGWNCKSGALYRQAEPSTSRAPDNRSSTPACA